MPLNHNRCIATIVQKQNCVTLLINVYTLTDAQGTFPSNDFFDLLDAVEVIIESVQHDALMLAGDWNCDMSRASGHCALITQFWDR